MTPEELKVKFVRALNAAFDDTIEFDEDSFKIKRVDDGIHQITFLAAVDEDAEDEDDEDLDMGGDDEEEELDDPSDEE